MPAGRALNTYGMRSGKIACFTHDGRACQLVHWTSTAATFCKSRQLQCTAMAYVCTANMLPLTFLDVRAAGCSTWSAHTPHIPPHLGLNGGPAYSLTCNSCLSRAHLLQVSARTAITLPLSPT